MAKIKQLSQDEVTRIFLKKWGKSTNDENVMLYSREWWHSYSPHRNNTFRLSKSGIDLVEKVINIKVYHIKFPRKISFTPQLLLTLDRIIKTPYYLNDEEIIVTSESLAVEICLFSNDIERYGVIKASSLVPKEK